MFFARIIEIVIGFCRPSFNVFPVPVYDYPRGITNKLAGEAVGSGMNSYSYSGFRFSVFVVYITLIVSGKRNSERAVFISVEGHRRRVAVDNNVFARVEIVRKLRFGKIDGRRKHGV